MNNFLPQTATEVEANIVRIIEDLDKFNKYRQHEVITNSIIRLKEILPTIMPSSWGFVLQQLQDHNEDMWLHFNKNDGEEKMASYAINIKRMDEKPKGNFFEKILNIK